MRGTAGVESEGWGRRSCRVFQAMRRTLAFLLLLLLSHFSCGRLCATPQTAAHQAPPSLGFSRQEHRNGLPLASLLNEISHSRLQSREGPRCDDQSGCCVESSLQGSCTEAMRKLLYCLNIPVELIYVCYSFEPARIGSVCMHNRSDVSDSCYPMDCRPPGSSVHGISQTRILEWVAISFSRGSSPHKDRT